jgi:hypothetical protein
MKNPGVPVNIAYGNRRERFQTVQILQNDLLTIPNG